MIAGSVTLHHWQQLAKPNLGGILHPRPGVLTKDFKELEVDIQHVYSLNDLEEDEPDLSQFSGAHGFGKTHADTHSSSIFVVTTPLFGFSLILMSRPSHAIFDAKFTLGCLTGPANSI